MATITSCYRPSQPRGECNYQGALGQPVVALNTALKDPAVAKSITDRGDEPGGGTAAAFGDLTKYYFKLWSDVAKANNIRAE